MDDLGFYQVLEIFTLYQTLEILAREHLLEMLKILTF